MSILPALIDSHCHLDFDVFDVDRMSILAAAQAMGIKAIVVPAVTAERFDKLESVCKGSALLFPAFGLHPLFIEAHQASDLDRLESCLGQQPVIAVGETGLDFYHGREHQERQLFFFTRQVQLAKAFQLPLILHVRKAHNEVLSVLKQEGFQGGGIVHAYSGSQEQAQHYLRAGFRLGIGGTVTYSKAKKIRQLVSQLPLSAFVLETDAPDMATSGNRGQRNSPLYLNEIIDAIDGLRPESRANIIESLYNNTKDVFNFEP